MRTTIKSIWQISRPINLLIILLLFYIVRCCLSRLFLGEQMYFSELAFFTLTLSTMLIAAGGYVINDYFDRNIDEINKPERVIVGKKLSMLATIQTHFTYSLAGLLGGGAVAISYEIYSLIPIQIVTVFFLWYYSLLLKRLPFIGNLVIATFVGALPLIAGAFEFTERYMQMPIDILLYFSAFSFLLTLIRELIKDMEDIEGDRQYGCKTAPIRFGVKTTQWIVRFLLLFVIVLLVFAQYFTYVLNDWSTIYYFLLTVQLPALYLMYRMTRTMTKKDYRNASKLLKFMMVAGIFYGVVLALVY